MNNKNKTKGFTLSELLVVVAIIAVLVAIAIPIFSNKLHEARCATDWANLRALYAEIQTSYHDHNDDWSFVTKDYKFINPDEYGDWTAIKCPDGRTISLKGGKIRKTPKADKNGYKINYSCSKDAGHWIELTNNGISKYFG